MRPCRADGEGSLLRRENVIGREEVSDRAGGHRPAGSAAASAGGAAGGAASEGASSLVPGAGTEGTSLMAEMMWAASVEASATQWDCQRAEPSAN